MAEIQNSKNQATAIIVIIIISALLALLITAIILFIDITVAERAEDGGEIAHTPLPLEPDIPPIEPTLSPIPPDDGEVRIELEAFISHATAQGDWLYFSDAERDLITVARLSSDGTQEQRTEIEWHGWWPMISAFAVTEEGDFLFLIREWNDDDVEAYYYVTYHVAESTLTYQNISDPLSFDMDTVWITDALFDSAGNLFIYLWDEDVVYIVDYTGNFHAQIDVDGFRISHTFRARDGQVFFMGMDPSFEWVLKGIDLDTNALTAPIYFHESAMWIWNAYSAQIGSQFDLYVDLEEDGVYKLHGYNMATGELTFLFNWEDTEVLPDWGDSVLFLENGRVAVLQRHSERDRFWSELIVFTP